MTQETGSSGFTSHLRVLNDLYLILEDEMESDYKGSVIIPDSVEGFYKKVPSTGKVISKGGRCKLDIPVGTRVRYGRFSGVRFEHQGKKLILVREYDLHAVLSDDVKIGGVE